MKQFFGAMRKSIISIFFLLLLLGIILSTTSNTNTQEGQKKAFLSTITHQINAKAVHNAYAYLTIPKIGLSQELYPMGSKENNIEKHVTILEGSTMPNKENSKLILASHSGDGKGTYFNHIHLLEENDSIFLNFEEVEYHYQVVKIYQEKKTGSIHVPKQLNSFLILTTCSVQEKDMQTIILAKKVEN